MAKEIYMSSNGVDTNDGLSVDTPIKSFIKLDEIIEPNSVVNILGGSVFRDAVKYDYDENMVIPDDENRVSNSNMAMLQYTKKYSGSLISLDKTNSILNDSPIISAAVIIPDEAITEYENIHVFTIRHRHNKHVTTNSVGDYSRACMWIDNKRLSLVENTDEVRNTVNSYYVENIEEPSDNTLGVCKYYFNAVYLGKQIECTFHKMIIFSEDNTSGNSIGVNIDSLVLCKAANKDGSHLNKGVATNISFEDCANHNQLKNSIRLVGCKSKGAGLYLFHQFSGSLECSVSLKDCEAYGDGTQTAFFTHDNGSNNSQKIYYEDIYIENVDTAFNWGGAKTIELKNVVVNGIKSYLLYNYSPNCNVVIKNLRAYNRYYENTQNSRILSTTSPIKMHNCAIPGFLIFANQTEDKIPLFTFDRCTFLILDNMDKPNGSRQGMAISNCIFASQREVVRNGSMNTVVFDIYDVYSLSGKLYFYNIVIQKNGEYGLPEDFGYNGNLKKITKELFRLKIRENKRTTTLNEKYVYANNLIAYYNGTVVKYIYNLNKTLRYVNLGSGNRIDNAIYITDSEGNKYSLINIYGDRYEGGRLDSQQVINSAGEIASGLSPNFVSGYILDWENGIIQINTNLNIREPDGDWLVSMDIVYDDCSDGIFVHDPNLTGDYSLKGDTEVAKMNIGYIP